MEAKPKNLYILILSIMGALSWASSSQGVIEILDFFENIIKHWRELTHGAVEIPLKFFKFPYELNDFQKDTFFLTCICLGISIRSHYNSDPPVFLKNPVFALEDKEYRGQDSRLNTFIKASIFVGLFILFYYPIVSKLDSLIDEYTFTAFIITIPVLAILLIQSILLKNQLLALLLSFSLLVCLLFVAAYLFISLQVFYNSLFVLILLGTSATAFYRSIRPMLNIVAIGCSIYFIGSVSNEVKVLYNDIFIRENAQSRSAETIVKLAKPSSL